MLDFKKQVKREDDLFKDELIPESILLGGAYDLKIPKNNTISVPQMSKALGRNQPLDDSNDKRLQSIDGCPLDGSLYHSSVAIPKTPAMALFGTMNPRDDAMY